MYIQGTWVKQTCKSYRKVVEGGGKNLKKKESY